MHRSSCGDEKEREQPFASARRTQWFPVHDLVPSIDASDDRNKGLAR